MPPRTVDNLGVEVSTRYAEAQKEFDNKLFKEGRAIPSQTTQLVTEPAYRNELADLLELGEVHRPAAAFTSPQDYATYNKPLFAGTLMPQLSSAERVNALKERLTSSVSEEPSATQTFVEERLWRKSLREQTTLQNCLTSLTALNHDLVAINSFRGQYHRG